MLSAMLMAFAVAVHAGDAKPTIDKEKPACCAKARTEADAKAGCPMAKQAKTSCPYAAKAACKQAPAPGKQALLSPKAAAEVSK